SGSAFDHRPYTTRKVTISCVYTPCARRRSKPFNLHTVSISSLSKSIGCGWSIHRCFKMNHSGLNGGLAAGLAVDVQASPPRQNPGKPALQQDLDLKLAALQKDYADLHAALFDAAQAHRRLCAPRLVRRDDFEIASEIFAVRYLPGDFFTVEETSSGVFLALGDICGHGLAAGMWTAHLVELVRAHTAASPEPETILTGVNRDLCRRSSLAPLASLFMARFDPGAGRLDYCSAGHPPAMLLRADGRLELLSIG